MYSAVLPQQTIGDGPFGKSRKSVSVWVSVSQRRGLFVSEQKVGNRSSVKTHCTNGLEVE